jgi:hypothetical protein
MRRAPGLPQITSDWVEFPMFDPLARTQVACRASFGPLRKIGGSLTSSKQELLAVFEKERDKVEARAKAKYLTGQNPPHIFPEDL